MSKIAPLLILKHLQQRLDLIQRSLIIDQDNLMPIISLLSGGLRKIEQGPIGGIYSICGARLNMIADKSPAGTNIRICPCAFTGISTGTWIARTRARLCCKYNAFQLVFE
jgi:hypothetical protein